MKLLVALLLSINISIQAAPVQQKSISTICYSILSSIVNWVSSSESTENSSPIKISTAATNHILVNGILVTGSDFYPLNIVREALQLTDKEISAIAGKKALSIGEGYSDLLPLLLKSSVDAYGLDLWYHSNNIPENMSGRRMAAYEADYGPRLIQGDARATKLTNNSFDYIFSYALLNNLSFKDKIQITHEAIRLLTQNGEARLFGFESTTIKILEKYFRQAYGNKIKFSFTFFGQDWVDSYGRTRREGGNLLIITKTDESAHPIDIPLPELPRSGPTITM